MEGLGINLGYLIMQILLLVFLIILLRHYAYKPIIRMLEERQARIAKGLEDARQAAIARDNADAEAKSILDAARAEAAKIRSDASVQAEESASAITNRANSEAKEIIAAAREDAEEERNSILSGLRTQVASISIAAANKLVGEALDEKRKEIITLMEKIFSTININEADLVNKFSFLEGNPAYPVFWDFAYDIHSDGKCWIFTGSSSD